MQRKQRGYAMDKDQTNGWKSIPKMSGTRTDDDAAEFFELLWEAANPLCIENIIIRSGKKQLSRALSSMRAKDGCYTDGVFNLSAELWQNDAFYTANTFRPTGQLTCSNRRDNLFSLYSFAIDIDFKKELGRAESLKLKYVLGLDRQCIIMAYSGSPDGFYDMISEDFELLKIPVPSYIECGHQLRLLYVFESPVNMTMFYAQKAVRAIMKLQACICQRLNNAYDCGAEPQIISGYYRVPGSVNTKDGSTVHIRKISGKKYRLSDLIEEYLPDLPSTPVEYKKRKHKTGNGHSENVKPAYKYDSAALCIARMKCFEALRPYASENHLREVLTFLYVATALTLDSEQDPVDIASRFNQGFPNPLQENELQWRFRHTHEYRFRNETIAEKLGISIETLQAQYGFPDNRRLREKAAKEGRGETRRQIADKHYEEYKRLANLGMKRKEIAKELGLSIETIKKYRKRRFEELQGDV